MYPLTLPFLVSFDIHHSSWRFVRGLTVRIDFPTIVKKVREANQYRNRWKKTVWTFESFEKVSLACILTEKKEREREREIQLIFLTEFGLGQRIVHGIFFMVRLLEFSSFFENCLPNNVATCNEIRVRWISRNSFFSLSTDSCFRIWFFGFDV